MKLYQYVLDNVYSNKGYVVAENAEDAVLKITDQEEQLHKGEDRITQLKLVAVSEGQARLDVPRLLA